ncbi:7514_t:CDS:2 [Entrophospora sp. SA101]|nr:7514_t:CDS:2 [Entrophospora sp. SA101]
MKITCEIQNRKEWQEAARCCLKDFDATTEEEKIFVEIFTDLANKMSESSATTQRCFDPVLLGAKPDFVVKTTNPKTHIELLIGEIKPPAKEGALVSDDLISLGKTMKCALDKSIEDGVDDLVICGLQIIGTLKIIE